VEALVRHDSRLEWMRSGLDAGDAKAQPRVAATLVLGNASAPTGGVHLALLCQRAPTCVPAADLAHLLGTLQPLGEAAMQDEPLPLDELGYELGIPIAPASALLDPLASPP